MRDDPKGKPISTASIAASEPPQPPREGPSGADSSSRAPLLPRDALDELRERWSHIQSRFVDEPRRAVEHADSLVAELMMHLAESFANERSGLEKQWGSNQEVDTEDLRIALQRYRSFFDRLLEV
jgi:hypothetical protein